jgi:hypothetical protein
VARWKIEREWSAAPTPGTDADVAFTFHLVANGAERQLTVEYAAPAQLASTSPARKIVAGVLDDETPPRRVIVARDGDVVRTEAE